MKKQSESLIQQQIFMYVNKYHRELIIHANVNGFGVTIPNSVPKIYHKIIYQAIAKAIEMLKYIGLVPGISDLTIWLPNGKAIMVEVKNSTGIQSQEQKKIQNKLEKLGGTYLLVRSLDDFIKQFSIFV